MPEVSRNLNTDEEKIFNRLRGTIQNKARRNKLRLDYHDMRQKVNLTGFSIPEHMRDVGAAMSWPYQACASISERITPLGFTITNKSSLLGTLEDIVSDSQILQVETLAIEAMTSRASAFVFMTPGDTSIGEPEVVVTARTADRATAERNPRTRQVACALEMVDRKSNLLYLPGKTLLVEQIDNGRWTVTHEYVGIDGLVMCTPYTWRETIDRPFGHSRISRAVMDLTDRFFRSSLREEVQADLFSVPRMAMSNADESAFFDAEGNRISPLSAMMGAVWGIPAWRDEETGDLVKPTLEQFSQASMEPHQASRRGLAMEFSGETKIPIGQLGIVQDNPSSADAIRANEYALVGLITKQLPSLGYARVDMARKVLAIKEGGLSAGMVLDLRKLRAQFADPGTPTKSAQADAGMKTITALPDIVGTGVDLEVLGLSEAQKEIITAARDKSRAGGLIDSLLSATPGAAGTAEGNADLEAARVLKAKADALGVLRRAGVERTAAAAAAGLDGLTFIEGEPITIKTKDEQ